MNKSPSSSRRKVSGSVTTTVASSVRAEQHSEQATWTSSLAMVAGVSGAHLLRHVKMKDVIVRSSAHMPRLPDGFRTSRT